MYYNGCPFWISGEFKKKEFSRRGHEQLQFDPDLIFEVVIRAVLRFMYRQMGEGECET